MAGVKIMGSLHMTIQTAVLIETLVELGADVRWCSCNIFSTQDHAAAAIAAAGSGICLEGGDSGRILGLHFKALTWPDGSGPDQIVDDGGDATLLIHKGLELENGSDWVDSKSDSEEEQVIKNLLKKVNADKPGHWRPVAEAVVGVSEETTTGVQRLIQMEERDELLFQAVNVNDSVTKSKFDNVFGAALSGRHQTGVRCVGLRQSSDGVATAMARARPNRLLMSARVMVSEVDPICALQACMAGYQVTTVEDALTEADIFVTTTGNKDIITADHMARMKDQAIVCNIGHFDNEIQVAGLEAMEGVTREVIKDDSIPGGPVDRYTFPDGHSIYLLAEGRLINLACATGHPSFVCPIVLRTKRSRRSIFVRIPIVKLVCTA